MHSHRGSSLLRYTCVHVFILAGTMHLQICNSAHAYLHAYKIINAHTFMQAHLAKEDACERTPSTSLLCTHLHLGAGRGSEMR